MADVEEGVIYDAISNYTDEDVDGYKQFEAGSARTVFDLEMNSGNHLILYLCTKEHVETRFEKEELLLERVDEETDIPTPEILHSDFSKEDIPFMYYIGQKIEGYNPVDRYKYLPKEDRVNLLRQSAKYLGKLHRNVKFDEPGDIIYRNGNLEIDSSSSKGFIEEWASEWIEGLEDSRFSDLQEKARRFVEKYDDLAEDLEPCCVHFDIKPENLIVKHGEIQAVIDWEKSISYAPEWDLQYSMISFIHSKFETEETRKEMIYEFFEAYIEENNLDSKWKERLLYFNAIWTLKLMADFEEVHEENKQEMEKIFRENLNTRLDNLSKAAEKELPNNLTN
jgi:aminoglycoside phosphotransferase (APT) family kinase protein